MNDYEHYEYIKRMVKRDQMISHVLTAVTLVVMGLGALACAWIIDRII